MLACEAGDVDLVRKLMVAGRGRANDIDERGKPALHVSGIPDRFVTKYLQEDITESG
jgi:hypothetical protein